MGNCRMRCCVRSEIRTRFLQCEGSSLEAVMRRKTEAAKDFAARHSVPKYYGTAKELIDDDGVDAVYVATPPGGDRLEISKLIVGAKKPCYMEKPLARDAREAREIARLFKDADVPLYCAYYRRCMPKFDVVKQNIDKIGEITSVTVTLHQPRHLGDKQHWHFDRPISGGGLFLDVGCHMLDLVHYLVGPLEECHGAASITLPNQGRVEGRLLLPVEDTVKGTWKHRLDNRTILGSASFSFCSAIPRDEILIDGTLGRIAFSTFDNKPAVLSSPERLLILEAEEGTPDHVHQPMVQDVVDSIRILKRSNEKVQDEETKSSGVVGSRRLCCGMDAVRTSEVMDAMLNGRQKWDDEYV